MINMSKRALVISSISLLALIAEPASADVLLTFGVVNVNQNACSGFMQPSCVSSVSTSFTETMRFLTGSPLTPPTGSNSGGLMLSEAFYGFANAFTGSPFTSTLNARLSGPTTFAQSFTQLDSSYDVGGRSGSSAALIYRDAFSDVTDPVGVRTQQEYKHSYSLSSELFSASSLYTDLVNESFLEFFSKYVGSMAGSFDELGSASIFDPQSLALNSYNFTEYTGDVTLLAAESVPEPGTFPLIAIAALALISRFIRPKARGINQRAVHT